MTLSTAGIVALFVLLVVVAAVCAIAGYLVGTHRAMAEQATAPTPDEDPTALRTHIAQLTESNSALNNDVERLRTDNTALQAQTAAAQAHSEGLENQLAFVKEELTRAQNAERERVQQEKERREREAQLRGQEQEQRLKERGEMLEAFAPVQENLDMLRRKVASIEEGRKEEMGRLGEQLRGLSEQQAQLDTQTSSLAAALRDNKMRGAWGEAQLKNIVESAGLMEHVDFDTQVVVTNNDGKTQRPDMIIHMPGGKTIPIDAKVPYSDYQRACAIPDTASEAELANRKRLLNAHAKALRDHIRVLADRAYWEALPDAPDFVIAFIPNETLLQAALEADPTLMDYAFSQKVALTSPVTLWAVLKSVSYAWQQQSLTEDAKELFDLSRELYTRLSKMGENANKLGQSISRTVTAYNTFVGSLESRVLPSARKLQKIDRDRVIPQVTLVEGEKANVRELTAPEFAQETA